jgi:aldose 1-epimerase
MKSEERSITLIQLIGPSGLRAELTNYGARLTRLLVPDGRGETLDVALGFDTIAEYKDHKNLYFGATVGRVANRTANASFTLDGVEHVLASNDGVNHLHGGPDFGFDRVPWEPGEVETDSASVTFFRVSPHLEEGYPGNLEVAVTYTLTVDGGLRIDFQAVTDRRTPVNLAHHTYWNLAGCNSGKTVDHHLLTVLADRYTPTDESLIPLGPLRTVDETPLDFRSPTSVGPRANSFVAGPTKGLDHNLVLSEWDGTLRLAATLESPPNGLVMELHTTEPGVQVYSGGHMPPTTGKGGVVYPTRGGICLEAQHFPDSPNHPEYPTVLLEPGSTYRQTTEYRFYSR